MSELSPEARRLIEAAGHADAPDPAARARVRRSLGVALAVGSAASSAAAAGGSGTSAAGGALGAAVSTKAGLGVLPVVLWLGVGALAGTAVSTAFVLGGQRDGLDRAATARDEASTSRLARAASDAQRAPVKPPAPPSPGAHEGNVANALVPDPAPSGRGEVASRLTQERREPVPTPEASPVPREPSRSGSAGPAGSPPASAGPLGEELGWLQAAQRDLATGRPADALRRLDAYDARFPEGVLRNEADAARVFALCELGRATEARRRAAHVLARDPASPLAPRLRVACSEGRPPR